MTRDDDAAGGSRGAEEDLRGDTLEPRGSALTEALATTLAAVVVTVPGVSGLFPAQGVLHLAATQAVASFRGEEPPSLRGVRVDVVEGRLSVEARIGVGLEASTPDVVRAVAAAIRERLRQDTPEGNFDAKISVRAVSVA